MQKTALLCTPKAANLNPMLNHQILSEVVTSVTYDTEHGLKLKQAIVLLRHGHAVQVCAHMFQGQVFWQGEHIASTKVGKPAGLVPALSQCQVAAHVCCL